MGKEIEKMRNWKASAGGAPGFLNQKPSKSRRQLVKIQTRGN
jgi:hypothetical protein